MNLNTYQLPIGNTNRNDLHYLNMVESFHPMPDDPGYQQHDSHVCTSPTFNEDAYISELLSSSTQTSIPFPYPLDPSDGTMHFDTGLMSFSPVKNEVVSAMHATQTKSYMRSDSTPWQGTQNANYSISLQTNLYEKDNHGFDAVENMSDHNLPVHLSEEIDYKLERMVSEVQNQRRTSTNGGTENYLNLENGIDFGINPMVDRGTFLTSSQIPEPQPYYEPHGSDPSYLSSKDHRSDQQNAWLESTSGNRLPPINIGIGNPEKIFKCEAPDRVDIGENVTLSSSIAAMCQNVSKTKSCSSTSSGRSYFWQYNSQCKGPKSIRMLQLNCTELSSPNCQDEPDSTVGMYAKNMDALDPRTNYDLHTDSTLNPFNESMIPKYYAQSAISLPEYPLVVFEDPVQRRYDLVHCSKLRRGDGNDVTPNLARLHAMGEELENLTQQLIEHGEIIVNGSNTSGNPMTALLESNTIGSVKYTPENKLVDQAKREKNKLASKICRLKKKAFHEANKIKYTGLGMEYNELATIMVSLRQMIQNYLKRMHTYGQTSSNAYLYSREHYKSMCLFPGNAESACINSSNVTDIRNSEWQQIEESSLYRDGLNMLETVNVTHAASRTDALVEEVLNLYRAGQLNDPLVKGMTAESMHPVESLNDNHSFAWHHNGATAPRSSYYYPDSTNLPPSFHHDPVITLGDIDSNPMRPVQHHTRLQLPHYPESTEYHRDYPY